VTAAARGAGGRPIDEVLAQARERLKRLGPQQAYDALRAGALLVDIRPQAQRAAEGQLPGALVVERNVLEWRLDPASGARLPEAGDYGRQVIVICSEGYASSLAAASLQDLGLANATDLAGGFRAWAGSGLPVLAGAEQPGQIRPDGPDRAGCREPI
jgi:rhodanese-related sulfurtransferase